MRPDLNTQRTSTHSISKHGAKHDRRNRPKRRRSQVYTKAILFLVILGSGIWGISNLFPSQATANVNATNTKSERTSVSTSPIKDATAMLGKMPATQQTDSSVEASPSAMLQSMMKEPLPTSALIHVEAQSQLPQLPNGCEATSLSMLLSAVGHPVNKMTLAAEQPTDPTPLVRNEEGDIVSWGNPNVGFVGDVAGFGYGIYHGPLLKLIDEILPDRGLDLTQQPFTNLLAVVAGGTPVEVWTTATFQPTNDWETWNSPEGPVHATMEEHAVLLVGYNQEDVFVNNPLTGEAAEAVPRADFIEAWEQLGEQAVTIAPEKVDEQ